MKAKVNKVQIHIVRGDVLSQSVGAVVHVTDPNLSLSPALAKRSGPAVEAACREIGWCKVGSAVITTAGDLPLEKMIHAVAARWGEGSERAKLANVTLKCLQLAEAHQIKSLAFPAISTGTLGYPLEACARVMLEEIIDFTFEDLRYLRSIVLCLETDLAREIFESELTRQLQDVRTSGEGEVKV
jgi:O-acetyl-ADP-ribose deacetylase